MSNSDVSEQVIFAIHTNQYSGIFEREMCAFITGLIGECGVGRDMAERFEEDLGEAMVESFGKIISYVGDEDYSSCMRPCVIWPTPNRSNNGSGVHTTIAEGEEPEWPAYESVAIFFSEIPSREKIELMMSRAQLYANEVYNRKYKRDQLKIIGFQLLKKVTTVVTETVVTDFPI